MIKLNTGRHCVFKILLGLFKSGPESRIRVLIRGLTLGNVICFLRKDPSNEALRIDPVDSGEARVVHIQDFGELEKTLPGEVGGASFDPSIGQQLKGGQAGVHQACDTDPYLFCGRFRMPQNKLTFMGLLILPQTQCDGAE